MRDVIATPPGKTIEEMLVDNNVSERELADRMGISMRHVQNLLSGKADLTEEMAHNIENALGAPARFWIKLEAIYRSKL